eukprot:gb/GEZN01009838.1/.p1 GENE.gb/GEZN01009838.1/~~gb/GEZN01009838.1/.p1  ORF type:complete len:356 (-),score=24.05 gb/GEZN01009838.1/:167-1234(-)
MIGSKSYCGGNGVSVMLKTTTAFKFDHLLRLRHPRKRQCASDVPCCSLSNQSFSPTRFCLAAAGLSDASTNGTLHFSGDMAQLGLGSAHPYWPPGWIQSVLEMMYVDLSLPWWAGLVLATVTTRLCVAPLAVIAVRNAARIQTIQPTLNVLTARLTECKRIGDQTQAAQQEQQIRALLRRTNAHPLKSLLPVLFQAPVFLCFFRALQEMADLPVPSLEQGGLLWFMDLTVPDPYCILPLLCCLSTHQLLSHTFALLATSPTYKSNPTRLQTLQLQWTLVRAGLLILLPVSTQFPSLILVYWITNNSWSLAQTKVLQLDRVRSALKIPLHSSPPLLPWTFLDRPIQSTRERKKREA